jgi:hypothetical protein
MLHLDVVRHELRCALPVTPIILARYVILAVLIIVALDFVLDVAKHALEFTLDVFLASFDLPRGGRAALGGEGRWKVGLR